MQSAIKGNQVVCMVSNNIDFDYLSVYTIEDILQSGRSMYLLLYDRNNIPDWYSSIYFMLLEDYRKIILEQIIDE